MGTKFYRDLANATLEADGDWIDVTNSNKTYIPTKCGILAVDGYSEGKTSGLRLMVNNRTVDYSNCFGNSGFHMYAISFVPAGATSKWVFEAAGIYNAHVLFLPLKIKL